MFLDPNKSVKASKSVSFAFDLKVLVPDYEVDGFLFLKRHYEGGFILRELILVEAFPDAKAPGRLADQVRLSGHQPRQARHRRSNARAGRWRGSRARTGFGYPHRTESQTWLARHATHRSPPVELKTQAPFACVIP